MGPDTKEPVDELKSFQAELEEYYLKASDAGVFDRIPDPAELESVDWDALKAEVTRLCRFNGFQALAVLDSIAASEEKRSCEFDVCWNDTRKLFSTIYNHKLISR